MAKKDMTNDEYELLFAAWKEQHGVELRSRKYGTTYMSVPKDPARRREMLICLIDTLCSEPYNFEEKDFGHFLKGLIVENCIFKDYEDAKKLRQWREHVKDDLNRALATVFKKEFVVKQRDVIERPREAPVEYMDSETEGELKNPIDRSKLTHIAEPIDIPDLDFLKALEADDEQ